MGNSFLHYTALAIGLAALASLIGLIPQLKAADSPSRHWLLLFGIAVLPGLSLLLGVGAAAEQAKSPAFCNSCHVMNSFVGDMRSPDSTTLASAHYRNRFILVNQCYTCHTDYSIFGPMQAKLDGLRHLWKYETGTYKLPIRLRSPYNIGNCLHCHGESERFLKKHEPDIRASIEKREVSCVDCHAPIHPAQEAAR